MSKKLKDPNKPAGAILPYKGDGPIIRNDGVTLQAANTNPWYVLATVYGEQPEGENLANYDDDFVAKNRRAWNGWFCGDLSENARRERAKKVRQHPDDLKALGPDELAEIRMLFTERMIAAGVENPEMPDPNEKINFSNVYFIRPVEFISFIFRKYANFEFTYFVRHLNFAFAYFDGHSNFDNAYFGRYSYFISTHFNLNAYFTSAYFVTHAHFNSTHFVGSSIFKSAYFAGPSHFVSVKFDANTSFTKAKFSNFVPEFYAAKMYEGTLFSVGPDNSKYWPDLTGENVMPVEDQKRAYNRLRLFMNKGLQIDEEQFFHRQEMRAKRQIEKGPTRWLFAAFEVVSDYGHSVRRPLIGLGVVIALGALAMMVCKPDQIDWTPGLVKLGPFLTLLGEFLPQPVGWSISNTLPFMGLNKLYFDPVFWKALPIFLRIVAGLQTLAGFALLFLFGLGLRNKFRLR